MNETNETSEIIETAPERKLPPSSYQALPHTRKTPEIERNQRFADLTPEVSTGRKFYLSAARSSLFPCTDDYKAAFDLYVLEQRGLIIGAASATELIRETVKTHSAENSES